MSIENPNLPPEDFSVEIDGKVIRPKTYEDDEIEAKLDAADPRRRRLKQVEARLAELAELPLNKKTLPEILSLQEEQKKLRNQIYIGEQE